MAMIHYKNIQKKILVIKQSEFNNKIVSETIYSYLISTLYFHILFRKKVVDQKSTLKYFWNFWNFYFLRFGAL